MDVQEKLKALKELYGRQLAAKFQEMDRQWQTVQRDGWRRRPVADLVRLAHQLTGTSGSFGFSAVSALAREIETILKQSLEADGIPPDRAREDLGKKMAQLGRACARVSSAGALAREQ